MFHFRIITTPDGNQIIDRNLSTPYESLTPTQMVEYTEIDNQLTIMDGNYLIGGKEISNFITTANQLIYYRI